MLTEEQVGKIRKKFNLAVARYRPTYVHHVVEGNKVTLCASGIITPRAGLDTTSKEFMICRVITRGDINGEVARGGSLDSLLDHRLAMMTEIVDEEMAGLGVEGFDSPQLTPQSAEQKRIAAEYDDAKLLRNVL